jgi:hypothetical protein
VTGNVQVDDAHELARDRFRANRDYP